MPITALYAGLLTLLYIALTIRIILFRRSRRINLGDGGDLEFQRYIRGHGNFAEYAPLGLILLGILEQGHWSSWLLHLLGALLLLGRLAHAWAFSQAGSQPALRVGGMALTLTVLGLQAGLCLVEAAAG